MKVTPIAPYIDARSKQEEELLAQHEQKVLGWVGLNLKQARQDPSDLIEQARSITLDGAQLERVVCRMVETGGTPDERETIIKLLVGIAGKSIAILVRRLVEGYRRPIQETF